MRRLGLALFVLITFTAPLSSAQTSVATSAKGTVKVGQPGIFPDLPHAGRTDVAGVRETVVTNDARRPKLPARLVPLR